MKAFEIMKWFFSEQKRYLVVVGLYFFNMKAEKEDSLSKCVGTIYGSRPDSVLNADFKLGIKNSSQSSRAF